MGVPPLVPVRINLRNRNFFGPVTQSKCLVMNVVFQLVIVKPFLPYVNAFVQEDLQPVSPEPISNVGASDVGAQSPNERIESTEDCAQKRILDSSSSWQKP